jgi:hypothetical protein
MFCAELQGISCKMNLIPFNPVASLRFIYWNQGLNKFLNLNDKAKKLLI